MMIKTHTCILAAFLLTALSGCMFTGNPLARLWFYTYSNGSTTGRDSLLTPASFLELRPACNVKRYAADADQTGTRKFRRAVVAFDHQNIAWAHTDSKYKMFLSAFQQMENFFR